ncbi:MAG: precorrin-3B C(17)-methyltransferase [Lachnospiraceae bacterium]
MSNTIYVVGIGPGAYEQMTIEAVNTLKNCDVIVGYRTYVTLLREHFADKEFLETPMRGEVERCHLAFRQALCGKKVAMISSGDAGVYGMSGLMLEIGKEYPQVTVKVVPGVTAALSGGAVLGAPLMHDFAVISLSDLLTPWEKIEKRLEMAAEGDFAIAIYNPSSHKRADYIKKACDILLRKLPGDRVCGYVRNIGREGLSYKVCTLAELRNENLDMFTTVFVGNSQTTVIDGRMVTPRGYVI